MQQQPTFFSLFRVRVGLLRPLSPRRNEHSASISSEYIRDFPYTGQYKCCGACILFCPESSSLRKLWSPDGIKGGERDAIVEMELDKECLSRWKTTSMELDRVFSERDAGYLLQPTALIHYLRFQVRPRLEEDRVALSHQDREIAMEHDKIKIRRTRTLRTSW